MRTIHLCRIFVLVMIVVALGNILLIDYVWLKDREQVDQVSERLNQLTTAFTSLGGVLKSQTDGSGDLIMPISDDETEIRTDTCGPICQRIIEQKVAQAVTSLPAATSSTDTNTNKTQTTTFDF